MKHNAFAGRTFKIILLFISIIFVIAVVNGCKKDYKATAAPDLEIAQAKLWYESAYPALAATGKLATQSTGNMHDLSQLIKPDWIHAATYKRLGKGVIETPVDPSAKFSSALKIGGKLFNKPYTKSYFLLLNDGRDYTAYIMTIIADSSYVKNDLTKLSHNSYRKHDSDFTGMVLYFTPKGAYIDGYGYSNGRLLAPAQSNSIPGKVVQSLAPDKMVEQCTDYYIVYYTDGVYTSDEYLTTICDQVDDGTGSSGGGGTSAPPPPCNNTPPPEVDGMPGRHPVVNYIPPPTDPGDGGMPPPSNTPCPPQIKKDTVTTNVDPCTQGKDLSNNADFKNKMSALRDNLNQQFESAYKFNADGTDVFSNGGPSGINFNFSQSYFANSTGFIHNHENDPNNISIFSADDFRTMFIAVANTDLKYQSSYKFGLVTAKGTTYLLTINNLANFKIFASNLFSPNNAVQLNTFKILFNNFVNATNTAAQNEIGFTNLLKTLQAGGTDSGLTLMKGNTTSFTGWQKVTNTDGTITYVNCN